MGVLKTRHSELETEHEKMWRWAVKEQAAGKTTWNKGTPESESKVCQRARLPRGRSRIMCGLGEDAMG